MSSTREAGFQPAEGTFSNFAMMGDTCDKDSAKFSESAERGMSWAKRKEGGCTWNRNCKSESRKRHCGIVCPHLHELDTSTLVLEMNPSLTRKTRIHITAKRLNQPSSSRSIEVCDPAMPAFHISRMFFDMTSARVTICDGVRSVFVWAATRLSFHSRSIVASSLFKSLFFNRLRFHIILCFRVLLASA